METMVEGCDAMGRALSGDLRGGGGGDVWSHILHPEGIRYGILHILHCVPALCRVWNIRQFSGPDPMTLPPGGRTTC